MRQILWAYCDQLWNTRRLLTSTGRAGGVGGSGEDGSFGFSAGGTGAVAGASVGADFAAAVGPSVLVVARADARVASAVPGTFVGATTHTEGKMERGKVARG